MGASSGIGMALCRVLMERGWNVGVAARRGDKLEDIKATAPQAVHTMVADVTTDGAKECIAFFDKKLGSIDLYVHVAGVGWQNMELDEEKEMRTVETNAMGFVRMVTAAYNHFAHRGVGHIAVVSSIAGTKGLGAAPAYSATKAMQNVYIQALEQQAAMRGLDIRFTDIRPGFVATPLLGDGKGYPMLMDADDVARRIADAIERRRHVCVIDGRYRLLVALWRMLPAWLWRRLKVAGTGGKKA